MMVHVMVLYSPLNKENHRKQPVVKKETPPLEALHFVSPRVLVSTDGTPRLILDNKIAGNSAIQISDIPRVSMEAPQSEPKVSGMSAESDKPRLKSHCCEKYLKGNRCKRCPCFDLQ